LATLALRKLGKSYAGTERPAVRDVDLDIEDGEFMVLLGPSGCGKSTTLRMIAGLETISAGELSIDGRVVNRVPAKDRDIAMVFQSYALYPHMNVFDNMAFGLRRRGFAKAEIAARVANAARILALEDYLQRKPYALSGGQRQRVALGRAIVRDPKVFLFDEPLSNLDAALRVSTRNEIIKLHRRLGVTMVYVTHDQVEAMSMGTRLAIMNQGVLVQVGRPLDVYRNPADTFVARFLGNPSMNLIEGRVSAAAPFRFEAEGFSLPLTRFEEAALRARAGTPVVLGIRPEDIHENGDGTRVSGTVTAVEALGAETIVAFQIAGGTSLTARAPRDCAARLGQISRWSIDPDEVHLFDAATTRAIARTGAP
jgi:multiple sugar transport system ATP-binding protein